MMDNTQRLSRECQKKCKREWFRTFGRTARYLAIRSVVIFLTVLVGIYAAVWVTNLGGYADNQRKQEIRFDVRMGLFLSNGPYLNTLPNDEREAILEEAVYQAFVASDLHQPFVVRSLRYFRDAFTLSLGEINLSSWEGHIASHTGSNAVIDIILDNLPMTLLLFGVANVLTFFGGLFFALILSRRYGSLLDRVTTLLVPLFAAPPWFHGIFLIVFFASFLRILPFGGVVDVPIPQAAGGYVLSVLKHMILPVTALVLGTLPVAIYANRALFLINSSEDYVDLAKAKGLGARRLERRYILRPVLPAVITNFVLVAIVSWQGIIITERVFNWPGLGELLLQAIEFQKTPLVIGVVTMFAYLLGVTVFFLDILYVMADPRVKLGAKGRA